MDRILIVEDSMDVNKMLAEVLTNAGYQVKSVYTGTDGIREIKNHEYDLVLLDIMLPYKSGDEILKDMRSFSETPVIIISAKDMVGIKIDLLKLGADDYAGDIDVRVLVMENAVISFRNPVDVASEIDVERIFDRFYTADKARSSTTGLGLHIVKLLAEQMGRGSQGVWGFMPPSKSPDILH